MSNERNPEAEIAELKAFIVELRKDRTTQKDKERQESWTKYTSMSLVFVAVLAAIATQWGGKYSSRVLVELNNSTFNQAQASDQWSYFQAKSIKENLYEGLREVSPKGGDTLEVFNARIAKYKAEKEEIKKKAEALEKDRDVARTKATEASTRGGGMGLAISIFQISIAIGSICLVTKKRPLWYISMALAAGAVAKMLQVWMS
ncbi:MAG: DUF4337 family protein [Verrucomicrobiota bacterium]